MLEVQLAAAAARISAAASKLAVRKLNVLKNTCWRNVNQWPYRKAVLTVK